MVLSLRKIQLAGVLPRFLLMEERIETEEHLSGQVFSRTKVRGGADGDGIRTTFLLGSTVKGDTHGGLVLAAVRPHETVNGLRLA